MLRTFAKLLGLPFEAAEDALKSEKLARAVLTRRGLLLGSTALLCSGQSWSFATPEALLPDMDDVSPGLKLMLEAMASLSRAMRENIGAPKDPASVRRLLKAVAQSGVPLV